MKHHALKRVLSAAVELSVTAALLPQALAAVPSSADWTIEQFGENAFGVYRHAAPEDWNALKIKDSGIDLSDPLHFYIGDDQVTYCGFAMMRADNGEVPAKGAAITDEGYYELISSNSQGYNGTYFYLPGAEMIFENGRSRQYEDGTSCIAKGMPLKYRAGNTGEEYYIAPGDYRFVYFKRQSRSIIYSDIYHITDNNGLYTGPGSMDVSFTVRGESAPTSHLYTDDTFDLRLSGFKAADGSAADMSGAVIKQIDLVTNSSSYGIPTSGESLDSLVSYSFNKAKTMYDAEGMSKGKYTDGRTAEADKDSVTLKGATGNYLAYGSDMFSLTEWDTQYIYRVKLTARVNGEDRVFYNTVPVLFTPAAAEVTIYNTKLTDGILGTAYSLWLDGRAPDRSKLTWTVADGSELPAGLTLSEDGHISGKARVAGTYNVTLRAAAANGESAEKTFSSWTFEKRTGTGSWLMSVRSSSYYRNALTDLEICARPVLDGTAEGTPEAGTRLVFGCSGLSDESEVTAVSPASGVSAQVSGGSVELTFDGTAHVDDRGIVFRVSNVKNPDDDYNYMSFYGTWTADNAYLYMNSHSLQLPLFSADGVAVTVNDWDKYKDMQLRLTVTAADGKEESTEYFYDGLAIVPNLGIETGESYSVKLEAQDALWKWYEYYSGSFTGDGAGNMISITPDPPLKLKGYTFKATFGGEPVSEGIKTKIELSKAGTGGSECPIGNLLPYNGYEKKLYLADTDGLSAKRMSDYASGQFTYLLGEGTEKYDQNGQISILGDIVNIDFPLLRQEGRISGRVTDDGGSPVAGASVAAVQNVNGSAYTMNIITDARGAFSVSGLYSGQKAELTAWAPGCGETAVSTDVNRSDVEITLQRTGRIYVNIADGLSVSDAVFRINGVKTYKFTGGSSFTLDLPEGASAAEGASYEVNMTSSDTNGSAKGTAVFGADGTASVSLSPERMGTLDWSGTDGVGFYVHVYKGSERQYTFPASDMSAQIPAGDYTVYLSGFADKQSGDPSEDITIASGEKSSVSIAPPETDKVIKASVSGDRSAKKGELYTISGIIASANDKDGRDLSGIRISGLGNSAVEGFKVNGKYSSFSGSSWGGVYTIYLSAVGDLSFPLDYTVYIRQKNAEGSSQTAGVSAVYGQNVVNIGSVTTRSVPNITIGCQERLGSRKETVNIGGSDREAIMPDAVSFSGTAPANGTVRIYDNDSLIAVAKTDKNGRYSGRAFPNDMGYRHTLRAECSVSDDTVISADIGYTYIPSSPVLKALWLTHQGKKYPLAADGASTAYSWNPHANYFTYEASIENDELLEWMTLNVRSEDNAYKEQSGKVFFIVNTKDGGSYTLPATKNADGNWQTETNVKLGDTPPTGVRVLYSGADTSTAPIISIEGEGEMKDEDGNGLVDHAFSIGLKEGFTSSWEDKADILALFGVEPGEEIVSDLGYEEEGIWTDVYPEEDENPDKLPAELSEAAVTQTVSEGSYAELFEGSKTTSDLFAQLAAQLGDPANGIVDDPNDPDYETKEGIKEFTAVNIKNAQARSGRFYERRTWTDEPAWSDSELNKRLKTLKEYGYKVYAMTEPQSGREFLFIKGMLYYDKYGDPVPSLYVKNTYSGIVRNELSDRIFKDDKLIGSILEVQYLYDVQGKKWARMQSVTMPPNVTCPIHTSRGQIPNTKERALRYTPAGDLAELMDGRTRNGGVRLTFDPGKVSQSTVVGFGISLAGAGLGGAIDANSKIKSYVNVENHFAKYSLNAVSQFNTLSFTGIGQLSGMATEGQSSPEHLDFDRLRKLLEANYNYYAKIEDAYPGISTRQRENTKKILEELGNIEYDIKQAGIQDAYTQDATGKLTTYGMLVGLFGGGYGTVGSLLYDTFNAYINACNDTNNKEAAESLGRFARNLDSYLSGDKYDKEWMKENMKEKIDYNNKTGYPIYSGINSKVFDDPIYGSGTSDSSDLEKKKKPSGGGGGNNGGGDNPGGGDDPGGGDNPGGGDDPGSGGSGGVPTNTSSQHTIETTPVTDPSGIVYEGVIENPVEGAAVTIYSYDSETGLPVMHDDSLYLNQNNPLLTDENGHYGWDVPEGEWYVTASKEGYAPGSSTNDSAAVIKHEVNGEEMSFLPVLPVQLDVNIPLVDASAPRVESVRYAAEGVYITFSKYMADSGSGSDSVMNSSAYSLYTDQNGPIGFYVQAVDQGHAPKNIDSKETTYTKTVLLKPYSGTLRGEVHLSVAGTLRSYAKTPVGENFETSGTVEPFAYSDGKVMLSVENADVVTLIKTSWEDGRLTSAQRQSVPAVGTTEVTGLSDGDKLFVWDSVKGMRPIAPAFVR